ncbi:hypothetical protein F5883DRAFT_571171 [Diaporthe sp. PMI_573]|nr:hypothetical protein F5883DRAFT_571171 [Diaporthaceae sp. PMI_573]
MKPQSMNEEQNALKKALPWLRLPVIANAPMSGPATSRLAVAVTRAGGLGQIGFTGDPRLLDEELQLADTQLQDIIHQNTQDGLAHILPIGVGIIVIGADIDEWLPVISKHSPAVIWLSFGSSAEFNTWVIRIRDASPNTKIWIQVGGVAAAVEAAQVCHPDALVLQGVDAGGHGHANGASIISLVPEVSDALDRLGISGVALIAAGGITDGRSTAAALALGAAGVVMGTRFLGAREAQLSPRIRDAILRASDGGQSTVRSRVFDEMWGPSAWPQIYDGRCLRNQMYEDVSGGMGMSEARVRLHRMLRTCSSQKLSIQDTASIWAGTGVGMVTEIEKAAAIVEHVHSDSIRIIGKLGTDV